jgi:hypothetical protein
MESESNLVLIGAEQGRSACITYMILGLLFRHNNFVSLSIDATTSGLEMCDKNDTTTKALEIKCST